MKNQNDTLFGGRAIEVTFEDGRKETLTVRQVRLAEYKSLLPLMDDEFSLCARICGLTRAQIEQLAPNSYQQLYDAMREVNEHGFFTFAARQLARGNEAVAGWIAAGVPMDDILKLMRGATASPTPSPTMPPPVA